jgi:ABC-2 type transport system permease protein
MEGSAVEQKVALSRWFVSDTTTLFFKYLRMTVRMPMWTFFGLIQPLLWLIIFGQLFRSLSQIPGFPEGGYIYFLTPGVIVMTVLFGSSWSGVNLLRDLTHGVMEKLLVAPVSRSAIVLSRLLHNGFTVVVQVFLLVLVATPLGAGFPKGAGLFWIWVATLLLGIGFSAVSNALAMVLRREEPLIVMGNMLTLPLLFFSPALMPVEFMPEWIRAASRINPVTYGVEAVRASYEGVFLRPFWISMVVLLLFSVVSVLWAVSTFNQDRS